MAPSEGTGPAPAGFPVATPLATGRTADVWLLPGGQVLRRYRDGGDVRAEAEVMRHLHRAGYPVPRVHHAEGADLVLDRVTGPTLVEAFHTGAVTARAGARMLAATGPVVIDWTDSAEGPPALDRTTTALILAEVAVAPGHPLAAAAGELLAAYAAVSGPLDRLAEAVRHRAAGHAPDPELLPEAAALVTETIRAVAPPAGQPSSAPRSRS
ncbi:phosphotransferase [Micromonospora sp. NPDC048887]|uniref:phosphotransferase n=1 Tax=unclassified Micromonospora TaxID=2617518 RepID=UPI003410CDFB